MTDTCTTDTTTPTSNSGQGSPTLVGFLRALTQTLHLLRLLQLLSTCIAFSLVASVNAWTGFVGNWCMFTWCFCFAVTLLILLVELAGLQIRFSLTWRNFSITCACYAALSCLSSSIIYPTTYAQFLPHGHTRGHAIASTVFSCIAFVAYATEVAWTRARPGKIMGYMATVPGLLKVLETFVACVIFAFISEPSLYHDLLLYLCMVLFALCFVLAALAILEYMSEDTNTGSTFNPCDLLSLVLYAFVLVIWTLFQFDEKYGGIPRRSYDPYCSLSHSMALCNWDRCLAVAILTAINFLAYLGDLVYSCCLN